MTTWKIYHLPHLKNKYVAPSLYHAQTRAQRQVPGLVTNLQTALDLTLALLILNQSHQLHWCHRTIRTDQQLPKQIRFYF